MRQCKAHPANSPLSANTIAASSSANAFNQEDPHGDFTCGSRTFTISGIYQLASGFEPPATLEVADIATGGSANKFGGGELVSTRTLPRDYSFSILVKGNSVTQNDLAIDCEPAHREGILPDLGGYADRPVSSGL